MARAKLKKNQVAMGPIKFYNGLGGQCHGRDLTNFEIEYNMGQPGSALGCDVTASESRPALCIALGSSCFELLI